MRESRGIWSWLQSGHPVISYSQTAVALFCIYTLCAVFCLPKSIVLLVVFVCCFFAKVDRTIIFQPWRLLICKTWSFRLYYVIVCKWSTVRVRNVGASCVLAWLCHVRHLSMPSASMVLLTCCSADAVVQRWSFCVCVSCLSMCDFAPVCHMLVSELVQSVVDWLIVSVMRIFWNPSLPTNPSDITSI